MKTRRKLSHRLTEFLVGLLIIVFVLITFIGVIYGIHYLANIHHSHKTTTTQTLKRSAIKTTATAPQTASNSNSSTAQPASVSNTNLVNTGPGDAEFVVFAVTTISGALVYHARQVAKLKNAQL